MRTEQRQIENHAARRLSGEGRIEKRIRSSPVFNGLSQQPQRHFPFCSLFPALQLISLRAL